MIIAYLSANQFKPEIITSANQQLLKSAVWIDLLTPTKEEETLVEAMLELDVPTREEMQEIEFSSRLYKENDAYFMTVTMVAKSDTPNPKSDAVTLILSNNTLISVRYIEPHSFALFAATLPKLPVENLSGEVLLIELLDWSVDRLADILENVSRGLEEYSQEVFHPKEKGEHPDYKTMLIRVGASGDLNTKVQESLTSFSRLITFLSKKIAPNLQADIQSRIMMLSKDIKSLKDHVTFLSNKIVFLLDATLGMINIEQNDIIKIFSIAAVVLLPPTLVASIYGMNFEFMPELQWRFGYPMAIAIMFISALLPYKFFKAKKWL